jgi:hypothetical protein
MKLSNVVDEFRRDEKEKESDSRPKSELLGEVRSESRFGHVVEAFVSIFLL